MVRLQTFVAGCIVQLESLGPWASATSWWNATNGAAVEQPGGGPNRHALRSGAGVYGPAVLGQQCEFVKPFFHHLLSKYILYWLSLAGNTTLHKKCILIFFYRCIQTRSHWLTGFYVLLTWSHFMSFKELGDCLVAWQRRTVTQKSFWVLWYCDLGMEFWTNTSKGRPH